jgi:hypothetical protein
MEAGPRRYPAGMCPCTLPIQSGVPAFTDTCVSCGCSLGDPLRCEGRVPQLNGQFGGVRAVCMPSATTKTSVAVALRCMPPIAQLPQYRTILNTHVRQCTRVLPQAHTSTTFASTNTHINNVCFHQHTHQQRLLPPTHTSTTFASTNTHINNVCFHQHTAHTHTTRRRAHVLCHRCVTRRW